MLEAISDQLILGTANSGAANNQSIPSRAVSITGGLTPRQTGPPGAGPASRDVYGNEGCSGSHDPDSEPCDTEFQPPAEQPVDWIIPADSTHGRPTTGQGSVELESWPIPEEFVYGRPTTGQEILGLEGWPTTEDFVYGRPSTGQEILGMEGWPIPEDFVYGRPTTGQETVGLEVWPVPEGLSLSAGHIQA